MQVMLRAVVATATASSQISLGVLVLKACVFSLKSSVRVLHTQLSTHTLYSKANVVAGRCLLPCGSLSPSLYLCRFASKNRYANLKLALKSLGTCNSAMLILCLLSGRLISWLKSTGGKSHDHHQLTGTAAFCLYHIFALLCLCCCFCIRPCPLIRQTLSPAVTDSLLPSFSRSSVLLVAMLPAGFWLQPACMMHCRHCTFNLITFVILTK